MSYAAHRCAAPKFILSSGRWGDRCNGTFSRSVTARAATRAVISFVAKCRRHIDTVSRSTNSGAANASPVRRDAGMLPSAPPSPSATARTLASTTITFCPKVTHSIYERHLASASCRETVECLLQRRLIRIGDQAAPKIFLQGLMCARSTLKQHAMSVVRKIFDLHTGHGAIMAPQCKCVGDSRVSTARPHRRDTSTWLV